MPDGLCQKVMGLNPYVSNIFTHNNLLWKITIRLECKIYLLCLCNPNPNKGLKTIQAL